ncbi:hypothetical protein FB45DRAFT_1060741 [Roridomyces roridus]|uniref:Uncharacterized protein n=1 Tax=Roridomyces roridus TaxID=1738132 RepID=A0AAD7BL09_9AGAR|nr:hypothetical protein FB45DRAFT_1060741 [Roridomyces roridus]
MALPPRLPPELERHIFELLAYREPLSIPTLILVAWRGPEVVMLQNETRSYPYPDIFSRIKATPPIVQQKTVHHLFLDRIAPDVVENLISTCDAVEDLWIILEHGHRVGIVEFAGHLALRRLHCVANELFGTQTYDFTLPMFARLTHLELFGSDADRGPEWVGLATIPRLTHLAFSGLTLLRVAGTLLRTSSSLQVLIFLSHKLGAVYRVTELEVLTQDARFVKMGYKDHVEDWKAGALGGSDHWSRAEEFVAMRLSGHGYPSQ